MIIKVAMFAAAKETTGKSTIEVEVSDEPTVANIKSGLVKAFPELQSLVSKSMFSVDHEFAMDSTVVGLDSEVAMIPPVSGG